MHIVIDCRFVRHTGVGRYIREMTSRLVQKRQHRFTLIVSPNEQDEDFFRAVAQPNVSFVSCSAAMYSLREQIELPLKIPASDIFWAPHFNAPILPIRAKRKIVTIHDMCFLAVPQNLSWIKKLYAHLFMYWSSHRYDLVLTVSQFSKREIQRFEDVPQEKIVVLYNAADMKTYRAAEEALPVNDSYQSGDNFPASYFLYVGAAKPHKNLGMLLEAYLRFKTLHADGPDMVFAGSVQGFRDAGLEQRAHRSDLRASIHFPGFVQESDMPGIYRRAVAFLFPSRYEGFGLPPLEAMACGCPVIGAEGGAVAEVCGDAALYAETDDPAAWSRQMETIWKNASLREQQKRKGFARAGCFTWEQSIEAMWDVLEQENNKEQRSASH